MVESSSSRSDHGLALSSVESFGFFSVAHRRHGRCSRRQRRSRRRLGRGGGRDGEYRGRGLRRIHRAEGFARRLWGSEAELRPLGFYGFGQVEFTFGLKDRTIPAWFRRAFQNQE